MSVVSSEVDLNPTAIPVEDDDSKISGAVTVALEVH
jgi:hypothetical protein